MNNHSVLLIACITAAWLGAAAAVRAESVWVSDEFEIMLRTGPTNGNAIERMLGSGTQLEALEADAASGYSRVRTASGKEGWVLTRYLMGEPPAREQLRRVSDELAAANARGRSRTAKMGELERKQKDASRRIKELAAAKARLETELAEVLRKAADVLSIDNENKELKQQLADDEIKISVLREENSVLASQRNRYWFITGAMVLLGGILLGVILPKMKFRRRTGYDRL